MRSTFVVEERGRLNNYAIEPEIYVDAEDRTGFTPYAELLNGRLAMFGFVALLGFEALTGQGVVSWLSNL